MIIYKSKYIFIGLILCFSLNASAQKFFEGQKEFGVLFGGANYHGDLAREIVMSETNIMGGAYYQTNYNEWFSMRYQVAYGRISGSDRNFEMSRNRNLDFYSDIFEGGAFVEFNFNPFGLNPNMSYFSPYVFTGLTIFHFNPKTKYNDEVVVLRDLGTEGQGIDGKKHYSLIQPAIPLGFGIKVKQSQSFAVGIEVGFRKTWTDYLDDVKGEYPDFDRIKKENGQLTALMSHRYKLNENSNYTAPNKGMRGDNNLKDWFFFMNLRIGFKFGERPCANGSSF